MLLCLYVRTKYEIALDNENDMFIYPSWIITLIQHCAMLREVLCASSLYMILIFKIYLQYVYTQTLPLGLINLSLYCPLWKYLPYQTMYWVITSKTWAGYLLFLRKLYVIIWCTWHYNKILLTYLISVIAHGREYQITYMFQADVNFF